MTVLPPPLLWIVLAAPAAAASLVLAPPGPSGLFGAGLAALMVAVAIVDARRFLIPDALSGGAAALGLARIVAEDGGAALAEAALRAGVSALAFWLLRVGYRRLRGRHGLGLGDVKLAAVAGLWLGWLLVPIAVEIAALAALSAALLAAAAARRSPLGSDRLPFGLFFAPAIWLCWAAETLAG